MTDLLPTIVTGIVFIIMVWMLFRSIDRKRKQ